MVRNVVTGNFFYTVFARGLRPSWLIFGKIRVNPLASLAGSVTRNRQPGCARAGWRGARAPKGTWTGEAGGYTERKRS